MSIGKTTQRRLTTIVLLLVSAVALAKIGTSVWSGLGGGSALAPAPSVAAASVHDPSVKTRSEGASNDAVLQLDVLKQLNSRSMPDLARNPFEFAPTPAQVQAQHEAEEREQHPAPPPPAPPPPVPFKAMGYQQDSKGQRAAYLSDDQDTYIVHEGQEFGQRFKVLRITDTAVEVQDETYHQIVQLPYPAE
ncbi:MAG TPA: hypothetical protein VI455_20030 [Terriglobia bacterium]